MPEDNKFIELSVARKNIKKAYRIAFAVGIPYLIFVLLTDIRIPCVFNVITNLQCPGCGITRMFVSLSKFKFYDAFIFNPFAFFFVPLLVLWTVFVYVGKPQIFRNRYFINVSAYILAFLAFVFGILRNIQ